MDEMTKHMLDVKERLSAIEVINHEIKNDLRVHAKHSMQVRAEVDLIKNDVMEARTVLNTLRWIIAFVVITAPAAAMGLIKMWTSFN